MLRIPPLRDRKDELPALVETLLARANAQHGRSVQGMAPDALRALAGHDWPGNVRELRNAVDQAVVIAKGAIVTLADLPIHLRSPGESRPPASSAPVADDGLDSALPPTGESVNLRASLDEYEARLIRETLEACSYRRADAAKQLGIPLRTLARRIKLLGIKEPR
jgi:DNA-binding NtrC family response regulator